MLHGFSASKSAGVKDIMCIHGEVAAASNYNPVTELDIAASGMDYIAMGHIHKESGLKKSGRYTMRGPDVRRGAALTKRARSMFISYRWDHCAA